MCGRNLKTGVLDIEFTGKFVRRVDDWQTGNVHITFTVNEALTGAQIDEIKDADKLTVKATKYRKRRSLDSNAYAWVLIQKIAEAIGSDKWSVYLELLQKYSRAFTHVIVKKEAVEAMKTLYRTCVELGEITVNGKTGIQLQVYYGSSTFDSKQMSVFIDGIVSECRELEIETLPPEEIERMNGQWLKNQS